jgi:4-alpha-glucanotransferase
MGDLGPSARAFIDLLAASEQSLWQMLPIGPPGFGNSPYAAQSAFAGNPLFVSPEDLAATGLLEEPELTPASALPTDRVDFARAERHRMHLLDVAFERWQKRRDERDFARFCRRHSQWLHDYSLFRALKHAESGVQWTRWERSLKRRDPRAIADATKRYARAIEFEKFVQYMFDKQWTALRSYARLHGVGLIGDIPLVVAHDSADVWQHSNLFLLDHDGEPSAVAGVPPDYFSATGQRWGNPLYRWGRMRKDGYAWWAARLRVMLARFDAIRLDHFIGFQRYWHIPAERPTAASGHWVKGPGAHFFSTMKESLGDLPLIAEDLGAATPAVFALRDRFGFPGIKVLQFAFGKDANAKTFLPHNYPRRSVVFTGTHDNDTVVGWFRDQGGISSTRTPAETEIERELALRYLSSTGVEIHWDMIRTAYASVADVVIVPVQDVLGLGSDARMNRPATSDGNWTWRMQADAITPELVRRIALLSHTYGRTGLS